MVGVAFGVTVGIGGFTFIYARGYSYPSPSATPRSRPR
jgi:hypothetical protein